MVFGFGVKFFVECYDVDVLCIECGIDWRCGISGVSGELEVDVILDFFSYDE